jgi:predicted nucleic acid-binding protein
LTLATSSDAVGARRSRHSERTGYRQIPIRYVDVELEDTLAIAARYAIYAYDAYLIRCGLKFSAPLLSLDRGLLQVAEHAGAHTIEVG